METEDRFWGGVTLVSIWLAVLFVSVGRWAFRPADADRGVRS